jgi:hypothetical protein
MGKIIKVFAAPKSYYQRQYDEAGRIKNSFLFFT